MFNAMYRVKWSVGSGMHEGPRFLRYRDALRYVEEQKSRASFVIQKPNGEVLRVTKREQFLVEEFGRTQARTKAPTRPLRHTHQAYLHRVASSR